jgi:hypothetical protein
LNFIGEKTRCVAPHNAATALHHEWVCEWNNRVIRAIPRWRPSGDNAMMMSGEDLGRAWRPRLQARPV